MGCLCQVESGESGERVQIDWVFNAVLAAKAAGRFRLSTYLYPISLPVPVHVNSGPQSSLHFFPRSGADCLLLDLI